MIVPWRQKAHRIIAALCYDSWYRQNHRNGRRLKRYRPYAVPKIAADLVECLDTDDEHRAKALFSLYCGRLVDGYEIPV